MHLWDPSNNPIQRQRKTRPKTHLPKTSMSRVINRIFLYHSLLNSLASRVQFWFYLVYPFFFRCLHMRTNFEFSTIYYSIWNTLCLRVCVCVWLCRCKRLLGACSMMINELPKRYICSLYVENHCFWMCLMCCLVGEIVQFWSNSYSTITKQRIFILLWYDILMSNHPPGLLFLVIFIQ